MKHFLVLFLGFFLIISVGVIAQTTNEATTTESQSTLADTETTNVPREYPVAAGVWYPGEPLPEKPFRYYRIRCWPGCHHNSQYGKYPDLPEKAELTSVPREYPVAAGVWYPGEPLPENPFRYYRIRCWPGCHHNSQYGKYPDLPKSEKKSSM